LRRELEQPMLTVRTRDCSRLQISGIPEGVAKHPRNRISIPAANEVSDGSRELMLALISGAPQPPHIGADAVS
jgi:hypothetical protein